MQMNARKEENSLVVPEMNEVKMEDRDKFKNVGLDINKRVFKSHTDSPNLKQLKTKLKNKVPNLIPS